MVNTLVSQFQKPVVIAETSYPWTLGWNDWTNNLVGLQDQLIPDYPATPEGQAAYLTAIVSVMKQEANGNNFGVSYWAADWVAYKGTTATDGSSWENQALFDFQYKALPALDSLGKK
jgi:arabinogalactan endo-1,4-beta-galactosidase